jgi:hypothetical protein
MTSGSESFPGATGGAESLDTRLGRLEGLLHGLQTTLLSSQTTVTNFLTKLSDLEKRQVELERQMVTSDDIKEMTKRSSEDMRELTKRVEGLTASENRSEGQRSQAQWAVPVIAQWGTLLVALLALISSQFNRQEIEHKIIPGIERQK